MDDHAFHSHGSQAAQGERRLLLTLFGVFASTAIGVMFTYLLGPYLLGCWSDRLTRRGNARSRQVALTFDDGPDPRYTPRCLEILKAHDIHATFFLIGEQVRRHPDLARQIRAQGHDVGNHTWSHRHHWLIAPRRAIDEVRKGSRAISEVIGEPPRYFRPPYGVMNLFSYREAARLGERCVLWSISAKDWEAGRSAATLAGSVRTLLTGGAIVLLHDSRGAEGAPEAMLGALPDIISEAKRRGLRLVALSEMIHGHTGERVTDA